MNNNFTPQDFISDLERVSRFKDNRVLIWYCNLYTEHFIKLIFKKYRNDVSFGQCSQCGRSLEPSFISKIDELCNAHLIDTENGHDKLIKMIYKARNSAGHELNFNELKVIEGIKKGMTEAIKQDPYGHLNKLFKNISHWENLKISAVAAMVSLYSTLEKMYNKEITEKLIFEINPEFTTISPKIICKNDPRF